MNGKNTFSSWKHEFHFPMHCSTFITKCCSNSISISLSRSFKGVYMLYPLKGTFSPWSGIWRCRTKDARVLWNAPGKMTPLSFLLVGNTTTHQQFNILKKYSNSNLVDQMLRRVAAHSWPSARPRTRVSAWPARPGSTRRSSPRASTSWSRLGCRRDININI